MKKNIFLSVISLCFFLSCQERNKEKEQAEREAKTIYIKEYIFPELTEKSVNSIKDWYDFKTIYQILLSISPQKQSVNILENINPDSLYIYKRLYPNTINKEIFNGRVERDWRVADSPSDTIYRFVKAKKDEFAFVGWRELLLKELPYTFSIQLLHSSAIKNVKIEILRERDDKIVREQFIRLDSIELNIPQNYTKFTPLRDNWLQVDMQIVSPLNGSYVFSVNYSDKEAENDYVSFGRSMLLLPMKYREEIDKSSEKLVYNQKNVKSSYTGVYFWLFQLEDELKQLWAKGYFPENLNRNEIKARLKLLETYVRELSSNVKEDPNLSKEAIQEGILHIRESFASLINYINFINEENLNDKLENILNKDSLDVLNVQP
ncbi:MAG: hypothetical protein Q3983_07475 [Capnocytophaga sp.]|nr:hypothetical protein [Capnocytophaga sp.]